MYLYACRSTVTAMTESHDKHAETHACDLISKRAALLAALKERRTG